MKSFKSRHVSTFSFLNVTPHIYLIDLDCLKYTGHTFQRNLILTRLITSNQLCKLSLFSCSITKGNIDTNIIMNLPQFIYSIKVSLLAVSMWQYIKVKDSLWKGTQVCMIEVFMYVNQSTMTKKSHHILRGTNQSDWYMNILLCKHSGHG